MAEQDRAKEQAKMQAEGIAEMVAALECDYERLEELRGERGAMAEACEDADDDAEQAEAVKALTEWDEENAEELAELEAAAGECKDADEARQRIEEDALSVEVRSGWHTPGTEAEDAEFCILLCTGGPAVRIVGELSGGEPSSARIEYQDWGTPWTEFFGGIERETLLTYCRCFLFEGGR